MKRKILFIGPNFYNYDKKIVNELKRRSFDVTYFSEKPNIIKYIDKIFPKLGLNIYKKYCNKIMGVVTKSQFDTCFIIGRKNLPIEFHQAIKTIDKRILYFWDSMFNVPEAKQYYKFYNRIYSFDLEDCEKYGFIFLPLFYSDDYFQMDLTKKYDLYCCVGNHSDRLKIISKIDSKYSDSLKMLFIVNIGFLAFFRHPVKYLLSRFKNSSIRYVFKGISSKKNAKLINSSKCVLDIHNINQSGLTIRTIETMACHTKIITTNGTLYKYLLYNDNNCYVFQRDYEPLIDLNFFKKPYDYSENAINNYSIHNFINVLFEENKYPYLIRNLK